MKIVQSLWTKPMRSSKGECLSSSSNGGWSDRKYFFMSLALSALQFRKHYDEVELVTDTLGHKVLIDQLKLPYTNVKIDLDNLKGYHSGIWALAKIYTYGIQKTPFIHADGDFFIFDRFPSTVENAALVGQNLEVGHDYYELPFRKLLSYFNYIPNELTESFKKNGEIISMNAGIIGGSDIAYFTEYCRKAFDFVDRNYESLDKIESSFFNMFFEQFLFYAISEKKDIPITYLFSNVNREFDGLKEFSQVPRKAKYLHAVGKTKRLEYVGNHIAKRLQLDYPDHYYRIINLLKSSQI